MKNTRMEQVLNEISDLKKTLASLQKTEEAEYVPLDILAERNDLLKQVKELQAKQQKQVLPTNALPKIPKKKYSCGCEFTGKPYSLSDGWVIHW